MFEGRAGQGAHAHSVRRGTWHGAHAHVRRCVRIPGPSPSWPPSCPASAAQRCCSPRALRCTGHAECSHVPRVPQRGKGAHVPRAPTHCCTACTSGLPLDSPAAATATARCRLGRRACRGRHGPGAGAARCARCGALHARHDVGSNAPLMQAAIARRGNEMSTLLVHTPAHARARTHMEMDLLGGYGDDGSSSGDEQAPAAAPAAPKAAATAPPAPPAPQPRLVLPPPNFDDDDDVDDAGEGLGPSSAALAARWGLFRTARPHARMPACTRAHALPAANVRPQQQRRPEAQPPPSHGLRAGGHGARRRKGPAAIGQRATAGRAARGRAHGQRTGARGLKPQPAAAAAAEGQVRSRPRSRACSAHVCVRARARCGHRECTAHTTHALAPSLTAQQGQRAHRGREQAVHAPDAGGDAQEPIRAGRERVAARARGLAFLLVLP